MSMHVTAQCLLAALLATSCGTARDDDYPVELVIENRMDTVAQVGDSYGPSWTEIAPGETYVHEVVISGGAVRASTTFAFPEILAFRVSRHGQSGMDDWANAPTVKFRGNVTGIRELPVTDAIRAGLGTYGNADEYAAFSAAGNQYTVRESNVYFFAVDGDTAAFMARPDAPSQGTPPSAAFTEDGVHWWRMVGPAGLVHQSFDLERDGPKTIAVVCERAGCYAK